VTVCCASGSALGDDYDVVVLDCAPALSLMNQNALVYADSVIVPVSCDYLSLVGVKQVLKTLRNVRELLKHEVDIVGVLPTFYDSRNRVARDAVSALRKHFGDKCLPPIRVNTKLAEAPSLKKTVFEHAPDSHGALDYRALVDHVRRLRGDVTLLDRVEASLRQSKPPASVVVPRPSQFETATDDLMIGATP
jgi:chromosome partitioning protein